MPHAPAPRATVSPRPPQRPRAPASVARLIPPPRPAAAAPHGHAPEASRAARTEAAAPAPVEIAIEAGRPRRGRSFHARALWLGERVLHFLLGAPAVDGRAQALLSPLAASEAKADTALLHALDDPGVVLLTGRDPAAQGEALAVAAAALGRPAALIDLHELPTAQFEREPLAQLRAREQYLTDLVLPIAVDDPDEAMLRGCARSCAGRAGRWRCWRWGRCRWATSRGRGSRWRASAPAGGRRSCARHSVAAPRRPPSMWAAARPQLEDLAERIDAKVGWDAIVVPPGRMAVLRQITAQVGQRPKVCDRWGFRERLSARGLG